MWSALLCCLLLGVASSYPPPGPAATQGETRNAVTEFIRFLESNVRAPVADVLKQLDAMETGFSKLLDSVQHSQVALTGRQDTVQQSLAAVSDRLDTVQQSLAALSDRLESVQQSQVALTGRQDTVQQSLAAVSDRLDSVQQSLEAPRQTPGRVLGESCRGDRDCRDLVTDSVCSDRGVCACADGFQEVADATCRPFPRLSEECRRDADCRGSTEHAVCTGRVCSCPPKGFETLNNTTCRPFPRLTEVCRDDADCRGSTEHAVCTGRVCSCQAGFWNRDGTECRRGVTEGETCEYDRDCSVQLANFTCTNGTCALRMCEIVSVERTSTDNMWSYRLAGGTSCDNGLVLAGRDGEAGLAWDAFVCDDHWEAEDARVACRSLGFATGTPKQPSKNGTQTVGRWKVVGYACVGTENSVFSCPLVGNNLRKSCPVSEIAAVTCHSE